MTATILYRIDPAKHMLRFYRRSVSFPSPETAAAALAKQRRAKERQVYSICFNNELAKGTRTIEISGL